MKITYVSPNRSHHVQYALAMESLQILHCFITGASRFSPRAKLDRLLGKHLARYDAFQTIYQLSSILGKRTVNRYLERKATDYLSTKCFQHLDEADVFLYYRTFGMKATERIKENRSNTLCVMEEVNSHVMNYNDILFRECMNLGIDPTTVVPTDSTRRLDAYAQADIILCPSTYVYNSFLERGFSKEKLIKNIFGVTPAKTQSDSSLKTSYRSDDTFRLLYVGQIHIRKGLHYAIKAFHQLIHPKKEFLIVGPTTPDHGLQNLDIPGNVRFVGTLKGKALEEVYINSSAFILPSLEEGLALVLTEALSYGLPVIATKSSGAEDLIVDGETGILVNSGNTLELLDAMQQLANSHDLRQKLSDNASEHKFLNWIETTQKLRQSLLTHVN